MLKRFRHRVFENTIGGMLLVGLVWSGPVSAQPPQWVQQVNSVIGTTGKLQPDGVLSWNLIRTDISFTVPMSTHTLLPPMASGMIGFYKEPSGSVLMTVEFPLFERDVNPFAGSLANSGIRVTAIHNHYTSEQPRILFLHADGLGDPVQLAQAVKTAWNTIHAAVDADGEPDSDDTSRLSATQIGSIIGGMGEPLNAIVDVTVPRSEAAMATANGQTVSLPPEMGPQSDFEFQPTTGTQAMVIGEFCLLADEVNPVLKVLRGAGFTVTAPHNHFLTEQPRFFFQHFEVAGDAGSIARTIHTALLLTNSKLQ